MARAALTRPAIAALCAAIALLGTSPAGAQSHPRSFQALAAMDLAHDRLDVDDLRALRLDELGQLRGVVFGRHGRVFRDDQIQYWLQAQPWYRPDPAFQNESLNLTERANLDAIRAMEAEKHATIEPGDLRWWQGRKMTAAALGPHSSAEWSVLGAEVEAIHGRRFDGEPWLQRYFDARYWYRPDGRYDASTLSVIERLNRALIDSLAHAHGTGSIVPCEMGFYADRPVTVEQLRGSSFVTLRILRNEIYARHGRRYDTGWLADHFLDTSWYVERDTIEKLSPMDQRNVATIAAYERALRASLFTVPLDTTLLENLFAEDARRLRLEIYARHGRVFRRKWEQDYVAGLEGYQADPGYTDARLTAIERANVAAIVRYEKTAASVLDAVEG